MYLKTYPTFDVLGASFGLPRSKGCEHAHRLAKALEHTLRVLPARAIDSLRQMPAVFADMSLLLLDATERLQHWPQAVADRPADYSGKKRLTRKNTPIADTGRYIHYLGPTTSGAAHDYQRLKNEFNVNLGLLALFEPLADLGYLAWWPTTRCPPRACRIASRDAVEKAPLRA